MDACHGADLRSLESTIAPPTPYTNAQGNAQDVQTESSRVLPLQGATPEAQDETACDWSRHRTSYGRTARPAIASAVLWSMDRSAAAALPVVVITFSMSSFVTSQHLPYHPAAAAP